MWDMTNIEESDNGCKSPETHLQQILYNQNCEQWLGQILGFCAQHTNNLLMGVYLGLVVNRMWAKDYPCFVAWCDGRVRDVPHFDHWHIYQRMSLNYSSRSDSIMQATLIRFSQPFCDIFNELKFNDTFKISRIFKQFFCCEALIIIIQKNEWEFLCC